MSGGRIPKKYTLIIIAAAALLVAGLSFALPVASTVKEPLQAHMRTAVALLVGSLFIGAVVLFLQGLRDFKKGLKVAYIVLSIGIVLLAGSLMQLPFFGLYDLWETAWVDSGGAIVIFGLATIITYVGVRKFAKLLDVRTLLRSEVFVVGMSTLFTIALYIAAPSLIQYEITEAYEGTDLYITVVGWAATYALLAGLLAHKIANAIGQHYQSAMRWLTAGLIAVGLATFHEAFSTFFVNNGFAYNDWGWYLWPFVVAGGIFVYAGFKFRLAGAFPDAEEINAATGKAPAATDSDYIDSVVKAARLASRPKDVDPILDGLRRVTASFDRSKGLTAEQKNQLVHVFHDLEEYLTTKDTIRSLTKDDVRSMATPAFRAVLGS